MGSEDDSGTGGALRNLVRYAAETTSTTVAVLHLVCAELRSALGAAGGAVLLDDPAHLVVESRGGESLAPSSVLRLPVAVPGVRAVVELYAPPSRRWTDDDVTAADDVLEPALDLLAMVAEREQSREHVSRLRRAATHDDLTGLPNRRVLEDLVAAASGRASTTSGRAALLLVDVDGFGDLVDGLGHQAGDRVLAEVARRLTDTVRDADVVVRLGDDLFVVVCHLHGPVDDVEDALRQLSRRVQTELRRRATAEELEVVVSVSVGAGVGLPGGETPTRVLLQLADVALRASKQAGRGRVTLLRDDVLGRATVDERVGLHLVPDSRTR